jgi:hypothetical protein
MVLEYTTSTIDPWPALPTDFPLTHIVTLIATNDVKPRALQPGGPFTTAERHTSTWHSTFILWKPVDAVEFLEGDPPCEGAEEVDKRWTPDHTCKEEGLRTGCTRQCDVFSGLYWCARYMAGSSLGETEGQQLTPEKGVGGRVCWGNGSEVVQLLQPCVAGDYKAGCVPGARRDKERSKPTRLCRN